MTFRFNQGSHGGHGRGRGGFDPNSYNSTPEADRIYLDVPFDDKDIVKSYGAKWNKELRRWYVTQALIDDNPELLNWLGGSFQQKKREEPKNDSPVDDVPKDMLRRLIMLCHPDKHNNSEMSKIATQYLLSLR